MPRRRTRATAARALTLPAPVPASETEPSSSRVEDVLVISLLTLIGIGLIEAVWAFATL